MKLAFDRNGAAAEFGRGAAISENTLQKHHACQRVMLNK
jgi:hypothetical protein